ncbi:MAG: hypothetical protein V3T83_00645 [Acidobacteriota bacterium]
MSFQVWACKVRISPKSVERLKQKVRGMTKRNNPLLGGGLRPASYQIFEVPVWRGSPRVARRVRHDRECQETGADGGLGSGVAGESCLASWAPAALFESNHRSTGTGSVVALFYFFSVSRLD